MIITYNIVYLYITTVLLLYYYYITAILYTTHCIMLLYYSYRKSLAYADLPPRLSASTTEAHRVPAAGGEG